MDPFNECRASFDLSTYKKNFWIREQKETFKLPCEEAKKLLEKLPPENREPLHRVCNLNLTEPGRLYHFTQENTPNIAAQKIDLFKRNFLPAKIVSDGD